MKILELYLKGFGKFKDKRIVLDEGLNIIYGPNESGKSTVHKFIEAMFFGFVKPGIKRRFLLEDHEKYLPWSGALYEGYLIYEVNGRAFKVERDLYKGRERVSIFDNITGEDITRSFKYDKNRREYLFCRQHMGINQTVYKNTISISQLGSKSDTELAREVGTQLSNMSTSGDLEISVVRAEKLIKEYMDSIGTEKAYTREYGRLCRHRDVLKEGLQRSLRKMEHLRELQRQLSEIESRAEALEKQSEEIQGKIRAAQNCLLIKRWKSIRELKEKEKDLLQIMEKEKEIEAKPYGGLDENKGIEIGSFYARYRDLKSRENSVKKEVEEFEGRLEEMKKGFRALEEGLALRAEEVQEAIERLEKEGDASGYYRLMMEGEELRRKCKSGMRWLLVSAFMAFTSVIFGIFANPLMLVLVLPSAVLFMFFSRAYRFSRTKAAEVNSRLARMEDEKRVKEEHLGRLKREMEEILRSCGVDSIYQLRSRMREQERLLEKVYLVEDRIKGGKRELDAIEADTEYLKARILELLKEAGIDAGPEVNPEHIDEYRRKMEGYRKFREISRRLEETRRLIETRLDGEQYEELERAAQEIEKGDGLLLEECSKDQLAEYTSCLEEIRASREEAAGAMEKIRGGIETLMKELVPPAEIEEELEEVKQRLKRLEEERNAAAMALDFIKEASAEVHREFAPMLNDKVRQIVRVITGGRYRDLRITRDVEIYAVSPETGRQVRVDRLSGGTVDQFYFACRMGIADLLSGGKNLPMILDDSFVQYDIERLNNIMGYLIDLSKDRQIIIFTCHNREKEIADRLGGRYNYMEL